jgi:hypothetical protein
VTADAPRLSGESAAAPTPVPPRDATPLTAARNRAVLDALPFADRQDFEDAARGFIATLPEVEITNAQGRVVWSLRDYGFLAAEEAPPTVNPSLWRQARLNLHSGLFHVADGIYQIRGFDISNMTLLEGERGVIVIDPLISTETARAGLELYYALSRAAAGHRRHLHAQPHRPLRRGPRRRRRGRRARGPRARARARPLHDRGRLGERDRGHPDGAARPVPVRRHPAQGPPRARWTRGSAR